MSNSRDPLPLAILWRVFVLPQRLSPLTTEETLDRGRELADLEIPWISLGVSGAFNLYYMLRNDTDLVAMLTCTATDTFGRTVGGTTGKFAGAAAGTILFGPAGAIVIGLLGATGGAMAGRRLIARSRELAPSSMKRSLLTILGMMALGLSL